MQATATHLSLETCKTLKYFGVDSNDVFLQTYVDTDAGQTVRIDIVRKGKNIGGNFHEEIAPAYTWYEVLMKYREIFIGEEPMAEAQTLGYKSIAQSIIYYIEDKIIHEQYDQADKYLRQHCILIPQAIDA